MAICCVIDALAVRWLWWGVWRAQQGDWHDFRDITIHRPSAANSMDEHSPTADWFGADRELNRRFVVYLPSKTKSGKAIRGLEELADRLAGLLRARFGGATKYPATGYFGNQKEEIVVIECYCDDGAWHASSRYLHTVLGVLGHHLQQDSIACSLDGKMALVMPRVAAFDAELEGVILASLLGAGTAE